ncbi:MAG TPA: hypothetical protein VG273_19820 [Bryobacteraceae bacterium]|jgi:hypothetical protein|nr:hypothetical protein [Bryobacteraceae bacterium]
MKFPAASLILLAALAVPSFAQTRYASGQNVVPVFEGWERNADGSFNFVFGYMNRNYEEQMDIPVGPNNKLEPGPADQGQPAHFYRRRQQFVFKVNVPKDWGDKDLVWTLTSAGHTEKAFASLKPFDEIGNLVYQENRGGPGDLNFPEEPNQAPTIEMVGSAVQTVKAGEALALTVQVSDDGHPKPRARKAPATAPATIRDSDGAVVATGPDRSGGPQRENPLTQAVVKLDPGVTLGVTWVVYRAGPGQVTFDPMRVKVSDGKAATKVKFDKPGKYTLRAYADDGVLVTPLDVTVTVEE